MEATIIFSVDNTHWLAGLLHPECNHVFCAVPSPNEDGTCVLVDLGIEGIVTTPVSGTPRQLARHYQQQGLEAWVVPYMPAKRRLLPTMLNNCVGLTTQLVGLRTWALTPLQLRRHLIKEYSEWQVSSHLQASAVPAK